ncbi:MAG TPA: universal stress protein [Dehalococcoidia bacterium]|nr:universal stress protein [Dehalococcoidia bacterium]
MYKKILVPLDGSKLAECALPHVEELAKSCDTEEVILVSVTEQVRGRTRAPEAYERYHSSDDTRVQQAGSQITVTFGKLEKQALRYLDRIAKKLEAKGIKVFTELLFWPPAEAIVAYAEQNGINIIVMSSHGRSGPSRSAHGSVADKVLKTSCVPVLMVRAPGCIPLIDQEV